MALQLEHRTFNPENPGSKLCQFRSPHVTTVQSAVNDYLTIYSGAYMNE